MLEATYAAAGSPVADVETAFSVTDFAHTAVLPAFGPVPQSVFNVCTLTWARNQQVGFNIHADSDGYAVIAQAFATVLGI